MRLGQQFESARRLSVLFALALRHRGKKASTYTFAERSELEQDDLTSMHNCIRPEVTFRALLTQDEIQKLDVVRA
jgi:hypothetical protein